MSLESEVKTLVMTMGFRHKNKPVELRALGNAVDTTRRRATFRFSVRWSKMPSPGLIEDMKTGVSSLLPTTQAYANDIDRIDILLELPAVVERSMSAAE